MPIWSASSIKIAMANLPDLPALMYSGTIKGLEFTGFWLSKSDWMQQIALVRIPY